MNEYKGFKVGDNVEITWSFPIIGVITEIFPKRIGGMCEPDIILAKVIDCEFDLVSLIGKGNIKKLPKYAVGDVVRYNGKIATIDEVSDTPPFFLVDIYGEGRVWALTSELSDFDGYKVGDTVWTLKRGKGKIVDNNRDGGWSKTRDFFVRFESLIKDVTPKTTNLIPTEAKHKEALDKTGYAFKIDVAYVTEYKPSCSPKPTYTRTAEVHLELVDDGCGEKKYRASKFAVGQLVYYAGFIRAIVDGIHWNDGKFTYDLRTNDCPSGLQEDSLSAVVEPKFKVGDAVYVKNIGHTLKPVEFPNKYIAERYDGEYVVCKRHDGFSHCYVKESDLRLWVETKFKYAVGYRDGKKPKSIEFSDISAEKLKRVKHLGKNTFGDDVFCFTSTIGVPIIFLGIKGDDIS
jgi:hypothetical protein